MEITGIEPVVPEGGGFTVHCITIDASSPRGEPRLQDLVLCYQRKYPGDVALKTQYNIDVYNITVVVYIYVMY